MSEAEIIAIPGAGACPHPRDIEAMIRRVADLTHRLNYAIASAVDEGMTVELIRCSRHHNGKGRWGDQVQPMVTVPEGLRED